MLRKEDFCAGLASPTSVGATAATLPGSWPMSRAACSKRRQHRRGRAGQPPVGARNCIFAIDVWAEDI